MFFKGNRVTLTDALLTLSGALIASLILGLLAWVIISTFIAGWFTLASLSLAFQVAGIIAGIGVLLALCGLEEPLALLTIFVLWLIGGKSIGEEEEEGEVCYG